MTPRDDEPITDASLDRIAKYASPLAGRLARALRAEREENKRLREGARSGMEQNNALVAENRRLHAVLMRMQNEEGISVQERDALNSAGWDLP